MAALDILRGVPASGKTTYALELQERGWARVNRDDIRFTLYGRYTGVDEAVVTQVEDTMIFSALRAGQNVVLDATNLSNKHLKTKLSLASRCGASVEFISFPISLMDAVYRDDRRARSVGIGVIRSFFKRYRIDWETGALPNPPQVLPVFEPYVHDLSKPPAYIVDTDGTVADHRGVRSPYDTNKYSQDRVHQHVANVVNALYNDGYLVIGLSGRDEAFREVTQEWWLDNRIPFHEFFMRPQGDKRMDAIVKYELFKEHIEPRYQVVGAFDDRPQVIRMWETIGVPVFNVGEGVEF